MALSMFAVILIPFVFTLLVILMVKTPRVGGVLLGALLLFGIVGFVSSGGGVGMPGFMEVIIVVPFVFVLLILLMKKSPKLGAGVIATVLLVGLVGAFLVPSTSHRRVVEGQIREVPMHNVRQATQSNRGSRAYGDPDKALEVAYREAGVRPDLYGTQSVEERTQIQENFAQSLTGRGASAEPAVTAPIWSEGVENEYEADICPSKLAAVRALARRMRKPIEHAIADMDTVTKIVIFQDENDGLLAGPFKQVLAEALPSIPCSVLFGLRNIDANEIGITLRFQTTVYPQVLPVIPEQVASQPAIRPSLVANARHRDWEATARQDFIDKPWVEDFAGFANTRADEQFVVARSWETCTSENEAKTQAIRDACDQVSALAGEKWSTVPGQAPLTVSSTDLLEGGFIVDQFAQSFDGMSGRIWRQALLIDTSAEKLGWLGSRKTAEVTVVRVTWARMILSALGVLVVIIATYLFLNMATRGYYVWSLRIAGVVLAVMGVISILLVLN